MSASRQRYSKKRISRRTGDSAAFAAGPRSECLYKARPLYAGHMSSPVSWDVAERVGVWVSSGRLKTIRGSQLLELDPRTAAEVEADFCAFHRPGREPGGPGDGPRTAAQVLPAAWSSTGPTGSVPTSGRSAGFLAPSSTRSNRPRSPVLCLQFPVPSPAPSSDS